MNTNKNPLLGLLFSVVGVIVAFVIVVLVNFIANRISLRADLTQDKLYTLSDGTKNILKGLDTNVDVRYYATQDSKKLPQDLQGFMRKVEDLLVEFKKRSKRIKLTKLDPKPDSDDELAAVQAGVQGVEMQNGYDKIYNGVEIQCLDRKVTLPFIAPQQEQTLEYDLARAISEVVREKKPVVGLMTDLEIAGGQMNPMAMQQGRGPTPAWYFFQALQKDYEVRTLPLSTEKIDPKEITTLIVVHPQNITPQAEYAIDQYVMGGGKLVAFVDPDYTIPQRGGNPMMAGGDHNSSLEKLFTAWGLTFSNQVVADRKFMWTGGRQREPKMVFLTKDGVNSDDVVTGSLKAILLGHPGAFSGSPAPGLTKTTLFHSSDQAQMVAAGFSPRAPDSVLQGFIPDQKEHDIGIRLTGKFKTAFPDGKPKPEPSEDDEDEEEEEENGPESEDGGESLKESPETTVALVGDVDFLYDAFYVEPVQIGGRLLGYNPFANNGIFVQNLIEQMSGDQNLISVRSRAASRRRFTKIAEMEAAAEDKFRAQIKEFEEKQRKTQERISELQAVKAGSNQRTFILSPDQQKELEKLQKEMVDVNANLREIRKNLREDVDSLKNKIRWYNIAIVPILVGLIGLIVGLFRKFKTAAH